MTTEPTNTAVAQPDFVAPDPAKPDVWRTKIEFRLSISPDPGFYSTVRLAALALRHLGPPYDAAQLIVSVGDEARLEDILAANAWSANYPVTWRAVSAILFRDQNILATHLDRYFAPTDADVIVMCDSDVCIVERVDALLAALCESSRPMVAGMQAHYEPAPAWPTGGSRAFWVELFDFCGLPHAKIDRPYSGDAQGAMGFAPHYLNYGFVAMNKSAFQRMAPIEASHCALTRRFTKDSFFLTQVALALMIAEHNIDVLPLSFAYNCSNDDLPFVSNPPFRIGGVEDIKVIHYLRNDQVDRRRFLVDPAAHAAFLEAVGLNLVNARLQAQLRAISAWTPLMFPG
jgi:hypothetical protein